MWFICNLKLVNENQKMKVLIESQNFTNCEKKCEKLCELYDAITENISKKKIDNVFGIGSTSYEVKIESVVVDEKTEKEKKHSFIYVVQADSIVDAINLTKIHSSLFINFSIVSVKDLLLNEIILKND